MDAQVRCHHCGEPVVAGAPTLAIDGVERAFCCTGCRAAAAWIRDAGLDDYYRLRLADAPRADATAEDYRAWMHPDVLGEQTRAVPGGCEIAVLTPHMRCAACAWLIDRALRATEGVLDAGANAATGRIRIAWDPRRVDLSDLLGRLDRLGYTPSLAGAPHGEDARRRAARRDLLRLGVAGLGAMQAMMLSEALYLDTAGEMSIATRDFFRHVALLVSTPVVFFSGWPFLAGMAREVRARRPAMDTLVATSILLAWLASVVQTVRGAGQVWFDAAVMFVLLLLAARLAEQAVRRRAGARVEALARARPALAWRDSPAGRERVPVAALVAGDIVHVPAGEALPADGTLVSAARLDEALLTGESLPVARAAGAPVFAGSVAAEAPLALRVTATGSGTQLSFLQRLVEQAQDARPALAQRADRLASALILVLFVVAAGTLVLWWPHDPARGFEAALAVLVVTCPCALSLAIPAALASAHSALAARGVLALRPDALEILARVDTLVFDKTGTLTRGEPRLQSVECFDPTLDARALAASLQGGGTHPLARAFAGERVAGAATQACVVAGEGIEGVVDGRRWRLGRAGFAATRADDGATWLGDGTHAIARFEVQDTLRDDAAAAVAELRRRGLDVCLASGDGEGAVREVAAAVGIERAWWRQSPTDKLARLREAQVAGRVVAMVGDGLNDAPVLAGADVSFAFARGAALAHRAADFVIAGDSLGRVPEAIDLARRARRIVRQNLGWALAYNVVALPFAALGWVEPWLAALGMALSSLGVTLNALRLRR